PPHLHADPFPCSSSHLFSPPLHLCTAFHHLDPQVSPFFVHLIPIQHHLEPNNIRLNSPHIPILEQSLQHSLVGHVKSIEMTSRVKRNGAKAFGGNPTSHVGRSQMVNSSSPSRRLKLVIKLFNGLHPI
ncbi:hypothetical protein AMTR_s00136p00059740, partial [Amborella trichopoda]